MLQLRTLKKEAPFILIVDDDEDDQLFLKSVIVEIVPGAIIKSCYDGSQAIDFLKPPAQAINYADLPDLIFLDINMSKLCGQKTTAILKKDIHVQHIPIIILTTASSIEQKQQLLSAGANDFYTKPNNISDLKKIVSEIAHKWLPTYKSNT